MLPEMAIDPICGMEVDESSRIRVESGGKSFFFCSEHCRQKFLAPASEIKPTSQTSLYTCPMHPEVKADHPGDCPKCGMALEALDPRAEGEGN
jgi:Cu+-exporting ATPase